MEQRGPIWLILKFTSTIGDKIRRPVSLRVRQYHNPLPPFNSVDTNINTLSSLKTDLRFAALKFAGGIERRNVGLTKMLSKVHVSRPSGGRQS